MWQHQLGVGCTWVITCVIKPDCSTQLAQPCHLSQDLLSSWSPTSVGLYLPPLGTCTLKLSCFVFWKRMENVCLGVAKCFLLYQRFSCIQTDTEAHTCKHISFHNTGCRKKNFLSVKVFICYLFTAGRFKKGKLSTWKTDTGWERWFSWRWKYFCASVSVVPVIQMNPNPWYWSIADEKE